MIYAAGINLISGIVFVAKGFAAGDPWITISGCALISLYVALSWRNV